ncbi:AARSD1 [Lepeophtheirus salmonis]|uniref:AARSD1 n=1 Tax=Lepeophtheirus salmonis TaxID=72036 RepID=A0A7R8CVT4_LEPSM|nr:AARSD1 [Lepeophtheirus salmonis]CAF2946381.1 AARSD1 [Lepeophtheirus salmonis]
MYACQRDSYLKEFETKIVALSENEPYLKVELEDTILFPEGGGQNYDTGLLDHIEWSMFFEKDGKQSIMLRFHRKKMTLHLYLMTLFVSKWTGIEETKLGLKTKSWWMAENSIEEVVVEQEANQYIRDQLPVSITTHKLGDPELEKAYSRGLPEDLPKDALIRIVNILEDRNMCCGTHVQNLAHLQIIKTLQFQKSKKTTEFVLYFIVGKRVERYIDICFNRELQLTNLLKNRPLDHYSLIEKALTSYIKKLGSKICEYLDGKGGGSGNRFNAKINSLKEYKKAVALVEEHFK